ncbi:MAG TPA: amidohydrolase family protein [Gemmatimonadaceae bacterium]|nr:amidohydrolase family protein [Gemmatimonadaceae bacterium]
MRTRLPIPSGLALGSLLAAACAAGPRSVLAQQPPAPAAGQPAQQRGVLPAPDRRAGEGIGPFPTLAIRGAMLIDGTGAPPRGPVTILIRGNRIAQIGGSTAEADTVIDATGMYVMPGFVDLHAHTGGVPKAPEAEYVYKLWLAHGVTTTRDAGAGASDFILSERERSARNSIAAPRIFAYARPGSGSGWRGGSIDSPEKAREWVQWAARKGVDGMKLDSYRPAIMAALLDEAKKHGLGSMAHLSQMGVAEMNAIDAARLGLGSVTHFYGLFESLYDGHSVQPLPVDYNYGDEQHRFGQVARQWNMIHPRGSDEWNALLREFRALDVTLDPTLSIYVAGRDVMRARTLEWHDRYTLPSLWEFYQPSRRSHGSYWFNWTTWDEVAWRNFYRVWMEFLNDYKNIGGRVTTGSDAGFIYSTYGFGYVQELELLQEAGFHPLEVIRAATYHGAQTLFKPKGREIEFGVVRAGMLADLVIVDQNPLENIKVLYGSGAVRLNDETGQVERIGGVRWTIKDGIVYDARALLADVARMVEEAKARAPVAAQDRTP